jgi:glycosyltransferase involved in cell wall biosynthesis
MPRPVENSAAPDGNTVDVLAVIVDVGIRLENSAVLQSQVGGQLVALRRLGYAAGLIDVAADHQTFDKAIGLRLRSAGVETELVPHHGFVLNMFGAARAVRRVRRSNDVRTAYVRGLWGPLVLALANPVRRLPYVYDVRGALVDERTAAGGSALKRWVYARLEGWAIRNAARVTAVTGPLAEMVSRRQGVPTPTVIPCCVDSGEGTGTAGRAGELPPDPDLGGSRILLAYSGGLSQYQQVPAMLELWRRLLTEPDVDFLLLTNDDPEASPAVVGDLGDFGDRLRHLSLPRGEVLPTLARADVGFMLREARELNLAASPVKFPEYLQAGLAVVGSPGIGDASRYIVDHDLGVLVEPSSLDDGEARVRALLAWIREDRAGYRERARAFAASHYDWAAHAGAFRSLYGEPASRAS